MGIIANHTSKKQPHIIFLFGVYKNGNQLSVFRYIFFSKTLPHLEQTNFVFPFFPFTPIIVPAMAPAGPKNPPTIFPAAALVNENFFLVSTGIQMPLHPHLGHFTVFAITFPSLLRIMLPL